jgi:tetratricopeptide (TPR) repeat protein
MKELVEPDVWRSMLSAEAFAAFEQWYRDESPYELLHFGWFGDGRSTYPVAHVLRKAFDGDEHLVMKFCAPGERTVALHQGWRASPRFRKKHLAELVGDPIAFAGWRAVFLRFAGGDLKRWRPLGGLLGAPLLPEHTREIVRSVVRDWSELKKPKTDERPIGGVLRTAIGDKYLKNVTQWASQQGIAVDGTRELQSDDESRRNPFALVSGAEAESVLRDLIVGKAHGDLSGRNIFLRTEPEPEPESYVLIDYDHFQLRAPLAWDPMHLLVALVLDEFPLYRELREDLIRAVVDPERAEVHEGVAHVRELGRAIGSGAEDAYKNSGFGPSWRQQFLLCLVGVGLIHVGRKISDDAKQWCFDLAASAAGLYLRNYPATPSARTVRETPAPNAPKRRRGGRRAWPIIDRDPQQSRLRERLTGGQCGAVVMNGLAGMGKTKILDAVLDPIEDDSRFRVRRRTVDATTRLDLKTFIDLIEGGIPGTADGRGQASLARLEAVLSGLGDRQVILAVDAAENLLVPGTQELADPDLDEALELLTTDPDHHVSVVLAFRDPPVSPMRGTWPHVNDPITVPQLESGDFFGYLGRLDQAGVLGLDDLDEAFRRKLHRHLQGNPRHAELVHALVDSVDSPIGLRDLADDIFGHPPRDIPRYLTRLLAQRLGPVHRRVLNGLAAFGTPVPGDTVVAALTVEYETSQVRYAPRDVRAVLDRLAAGLVVYRTEDGDYFVPDSEARIFLGLMDPQAKVDLLADVADELSTLGAGEITGVPDLRFRFAEVHALIESGLHRLAYPVIETIDRHLRKWNCRYLLEKQRTNVRDNLADDHLEMANENALADIHVARGEFGPAGTAYQKALTKADTLRDRHAKLKIHLNQASMHLEANRTRIARDFFQMVLDDPDRIDDLSVRMGALEGLADCDRRNGRFVSAIKSAKLALSLPQDANFPRTRTAAEFSTVRSVIIQLKLSRWYAEQGDLDTAEIWMRSAETAATEEWLRLACLDGRADLLLAQGDLPGAIRTAREAVDGALATYDPITLLRARTTLCVAHLRREETAEARQEADRAGRHLRPGRSLLVLALRGLITRQKQDAGSARTMFERLEKEASQRLHDDENDFASLDLLAFALSALALDGRAGLDEARRNLEKARLLTPDAPGLVERLRVLFDVLDECKPGVLGPVLAVLDAYRAD